MFVTVVLLLAAVGLLIASLGVDHAGLAWGSVALSVVVAVMILRRWRRSWLQRQDAPEDDPVPLEDEPADLEHGPHAVGPGLTTATFATVAPDVEPAAAPSANIQAGDSVQPGDAVTDDAEPDEEDTDAADLLVVYELTDEVLVVDEHPRYHLDRCRWPNRTSAERLPVREARELGFTPCGRCRPDTTLARKYRTAHAEITESG